MTSTTISAKMVKYSFIDVMGDKKIIDEKKILVSPPSMSFEQIKTLAKEYKKNHEGTECLTLDVSDIKKDVEIAYRQLLLAMRIDPDNMNVAETPMRIAKMFVDEVYKGRYHPLPNAKVFDSEVKEDYTQDIISVGPLKTRSACSHHFVPTIGVCYVSYIPGVEEVSNEDGTKYILHAPGLSKIERLVDHVVSKPYMQEDALDDVANVLLTELKLGAVNVNISAEHLCTTWRGVKSEGSKMQQSVWYMNSKRLRHWSSTSVVTELRKATEDLIRRS